MKCVLCQELILVPPDALTVRTSCDNHPQFVEYLITKNKIDFLALRESSYNLWLYMNHDGFKHTPSKKMFLLDHHLEVVATIPTPEEVTYDSLMSVFNRVLNLRAFL